MTLTPELTIISTAREDLELLTPEEIGERIQNKDWRMNNLYFIVDEKGEKIPFTMNLIQSRIHKEKRGKKVVILKYRQGGVSTYKIIDHVDDTYFGGRNRTNYFVTHRQDLLDEFFKKAKFTIDNIHPKIKAFLPTPKNDNANEIYIKETNNTLKIVLDVRGKTPTNLHVSEFAWMTPEKQKELFLAMEQFRECNITIESTANGLGDVFFELCMNSKNGDSEYQLLFYGFDIEDRNERDATNFEPTEDEKLYYENYLKQYGKERGYRKLSWRRMKINTAKALGNDGEKLFDQENPITIEHAFVSSGSAVFDLTQTFQIQKPLRELEGFKLFLEPCDELVIGVDMAEGGQKGDYSTISGRRRDGKVAFTFRARVNEIILSQKMDFILNYHVEGKTYRGVIFPENNIGQAFINECKKYKWFQYMLQARKHDSVDDDNLVQKYGFRTTMTSKDLIIREYRGGLYRKEIWITDEIYAEIRTYQFDKNNRPNAIAPNHDDLLMADMIAYNGVLHESFVVHHAPIERNPDDMTHLEKLAARIRRGEYAEETY